MTPIFVGLLAALFLKEKLTIRMLMGSVLAIIGIYFVVVKGGGSSSLHFDKGLIWIVVTMVTFAIMIIITRVLAQRIDPLTITLYSNLVGFIVSVPFAFSLDIPLRMSSDITDWALLIGTTVVVHGVATLIWNNNIRHVDASKASVLSNLEPFVAMIMGLILLSKPITGVEILGSLFILAGVMLSTYQRRMRTKRTMG
ncbi:drug/metabolite transporter (DMT)-like permease [Paenibacillus anaericanus]|uniref:DMT family transporter n=1 Tax=Paenibacillus anaericanus TaxID=170367 RepID=UPI00278176E0|nr:DMT family transporter [Paenibacillus anaericanus]MDQ0091167.1 drug/metabolite transporter (DMT)-like permease [Paenibacillus anaericanus]